MSEVNRPETGSIAWVVLRSENPGQAEAFYTRLLPSEGLPALDWLRFQQPSRVQRSAASTPSWIPHVVVPDVERVVRAALEAGGERVDQPEQGADEAVLRDPAGGEVEVSRGTPGPGSPGQRRPIYVPQALLGAGELARVTPFYSMVFGWRVEDRASRWFVNEMGTPVVRIWETSALTPVRQRWEMILSTSRLDETVQAAVEEGGRIVPHAAPGLPSRTVRITDPVGTPFELTDEITPCVHGNFYGCPEPNCPG